MPIVVSSQITNSLLAFNIQSYYELFRFREIHGNLIRKFNRRQVHFAPI